MKRGALKRKYKKSSRKRKYSSSSDSSDLLDSSNSSNSSLDTSSETDSSSDSSSSNDSSSVLDERDKSLTKSSKSYKTRKKRQKDHRKKQLLKAHSKKKKSYTTQSKISTPPPADSDSDDSDDSSLHQISSSGSDDDDDEQDPQKDLSGRPKHAFHSQYQLNSIIFNQDNHLPPQIQEICSSSKKKPKTFTHQTDPIFHPSPALESAIMSTPIEPSVNFSKAVKHFMYGFGDSIESNPETVNLVSDLVLGFIQNISRETIRLATEEQQKQPVKVFESPIPPPYATPQQILEHSLSKKGAIKPTPDHLLAVLEDHVLFRDHANALYQAQKEHDKEKSDRKKKQQNLPL